MPLHMFYFALKQGTETGFPKPFLRELGIFKRDPGLMDRGRYAVKTDVDPDVFAMFLAGLGSEPVDVNLDNVEQLRALCEELGFSKLDDEIRAVLARGGDLRVHKKLASVSGRVDRHDVLIEQLHRRVLELERLLQEVRDVPQRVESVERRLAETAQGLSEVQRKGVGAPAEGMREARDPTNAGNADALAAGVARLKGAEAKVTTTPIRGAVPAQAPGQEFAYDPARPLEGIIASLTRQHGNVHKNGIVEVTASGWRDSGCKAENIVDENKALRFASRNEPNSWVCYTFKGRRVALTSYSIRADTCAFPRSWAIDVSNDGATWHRADRRNDNGDLKGEYVVHNFAVGTPPPGGFSMVRFTQTGKNHAGHDGLCLNFFEVFGTLFTQ